MSPLSSLLSQSHQIMVVYDIAAFVKRIATKFIGCFTDQSFYEPEVVKSKFDTSSIGALDQVIDLCLAACLNYRYTAVLVRHYSDR